MPVNGLFYYQRPFITVINDASKSLKVNIILQFTCKCINLWPHAVWTGNNIRFRKKKKCNLWWLK